VSLNESGKYLNGEGSELRISSELKVEVKHEDPEERKQL